MCKQNLKLLQADRLEYMDIAKGIGILAIIAGHMGISHINRFVFTFHVPLFFLVSGYFISRNSTLKEFTKKKVKALLIPYIYTSVILVFIKVPVDIVKGDVYSIPSDMLNTLIRAFYASGSNSNNTLFGIRQIGAIWFLFALLWALLFTKIALENRYGVIYILAIAVLSYISTPYIWLPWSIQAGGTAAIFVYIGAKVKEWNLLSTTNWFLFIVGCFLLVYEYIHGIKVISVCNKYYGLVSVVGAILISYVVIIISKLLENVEPIKKILLFYGQNSLMILCYHLIELNNAPWGKLYGCMNFVNIPRILQVLFVFCSKILFVSVCTWITLKSSVLRKIFGKK